MALPPLARETAADRPSSAPILDHLAARAAQLYSLPAVAVEILQLTGDGEVDRPALKRCLENDPALTTRILKAVNSSLFGLTRKVSDLGQALALLGVKPLKMLVLGFTLPSELTAQMDKEVLGQYWRHTLLKAAACRELSHRLFPARGEEAFTAGLLADIGELVLIQQLGQSYIRFRHQVCQEQRPLRDAEWLALGFDHVELSARLLAQWGLPQPLIAAIAAPDREVSDTASADRPLVQMLHVAELMARVVGCEAAAGMGVLIACSRDELGLSPEQVQEILAGLGQRAEELARILSLDLPSSNLELSAAAHTRLAETSAELLVCAGEDAMLSEMAALQSEMQAVLRRKIQPGSIQTAVHAPSDCRPASAAWETPSAPEPLADFGQPQLLREVGRSLARCRGEQNSFTLVLVRAHSGMPGEAPCDVEQTPKELRRALRHWSQGRGAVLPAETDCFALLWEGCKRSEGFILARHVLDLAQANSLDGEGVLPAGWMLSAGLASVTLPPRNFPPYELVAAAQRCLSGAMHSGGNAVKSIEF